MHKKCAERRRRQKKSLNANNLRARLSAAAAAESRLLLKNSENFILTNLLLCWVLFVRFMFDFYLSRLTSRLGNSSSPHDVRGGGKAEATGVCGNIFMCAEAGNICIESNEKGFYSRGSAFLREIVSNLNVQQTQQQLRARNPNWIFFRWANARLVAEKKVFHRSNIEFKYFNNLFRILSLFERLIEPH